MSGDRDREIMHFTHVNNLPDIVHGVGLLADTELRRLGRQVVDCADRDIKARRRARAVDVPPYGVVGDYVPFYFAPRSPMLYVISRGSVLSYSEGQAPLVYLVTSISHIAEAGLQWVGSDGNCAAEFTEFYTDRSELEEAVDWLLMRATYWNNTAEDGDRMRRRAAELLVHRKVTWKCIRRVVTRSELIAAQVREMTRDNPIPVTVRPDWYY
jgi:ssDNA thymidine ADP-ribosyltransferase, DarT